MLFRSIITLDKLAPLLQARRHRPLFMIDLAMPRDIEPAVRKLDSVYLYDLDALQSIAEQTLAVRRQEAEKCHQLIEHHVQDFQRWIECSQSSNFPSIIVELQEGAMKINSRHERQLARFGHAEVSHSTSTPSWPPERSRRLTVLSS